MSEFLDDVLEIVKEIKLAGLEIVKSEDVGDVLSVYVPS